MYARFFKRALDFLVSLAVLAVLSPILIIFTLIGAIAMRGNPFFVQPRPGRCGKDGKEKIFYLIKFRSMTNRKDKSGRLLPDAVRLSGYGKFLRASSIDELPSLINILVGDMSFVGPRPQLVRDMVFMTDEERRRHRVRPGMTGLAQVNGRNNIPWERKFEYDLEYIDSGISFLGDMKIIFKTVGKVLACKDTVREGTVSDLDLGDYLLELGRVEKEEYDKKQEEAKALLKK